MNRITTISNHAVDPNGSDHLQTSGHIWCRAAAIMPNSLTWMQLSNKVKKKLPEKTLCKSRKREASGHGHNTTIKRLIKLCYSLKTMWLTIYVKSTEIGCEQHCSAMHKPCSNAEQKLT